MTVQESVRKVFRTGTGSLDEFDFPMKYFNDNEIATDVDGVTINSDYYTLTRNPSGDGGTITFDTEHIPEAPDTPGDRNVLIYRTLPYTQESRIPTVDKLGQGLLEVTYDKQVMLSQQLREESARSLKFPISVATGDGDDNIEDVAEIPAPPGARRALMITEDDQFEWSDLDPDEELGNVSESVTLAQNAAAQAASSADDASDSASSAATDAQRAEDAAEAAEAVNELTSKGDLLTHNGTNNVRLPVGTNGYYLSANNGVAAGLEWLVFPTIPTIHFPTRYMRGPAVSWVSATTIQIPQGFVCRSSDDTEDMVVAANRSVAITSSGANGLDTGAEASNTWYYVYVIKNTSTGDVMGLLSVTNEAASGSITLPSGYTKKRQLPIAVRNDNSSNFIKFYVAGGWPNNAIVMYDTDFTGTNTDATNVATGLSSGSFAAQSLASYLPAGISRTALLHFEKVTSGTVNFRPTGSSATSGVAYTLVDNSFDETTVGVNSSGQVDYKVSSGSIDLSVRGFIVTEVY